MRRLGVLRFTEGGCCGRQRSSRCGNPSLRKTGQSGLGGLGSFEAGRSVHDRPNACHDSAMMYMQLICDDMPPSGMGISWRVEETKQVRRHPGQFPERSNRSGPEQSLAYQMNLQL